MQIGTLPEQVNTEELDDDSFLERIWNAITNREVLGAGYEIGAGLTFDAATAPLGWAPPVYAALNFGEGYVSNVIAQKIRGQKWNEIDWNEALSSGVLGTIPLSQLKVAKNLRRVGLQSATEPVEKVVGKAGTLQRNIISGGITGGGDVTLRSGLEGELPDPAELATGVVGGGALAGTLTPVLKRTSKYVNEIVAKRKANKAESELLSKQLEIQEKIKNDPNSLTPEDTRALRKAIWNVDKAKGDYGPFDSFEEFEQKSSQLLGSIENKIDGNPDSVNWMDYGYDSTGRHSEPEQVKRAYRTSEEMGVQVSQDLNQFYKKINSWVSSQLYDKEPTVQSITPLLRNYPFYWINPQTQKVYKIAARSNKLGKPRFTLESHSRRFLEGQQSSPIQKKNVKYINQIRTELNKQVKADYTARQSELVEEINRIDTQINYELTHKRQAYSAKGSLAALMNRRNSTVQSLENLLDGEYYLEHGYYLASEKIRNRVKDSKGVPINDSTEYQLGNAKNISIVYDVKNLEESLRFREVKNLFEFVLDTKLPNGEYKYPNLVVNYSPNRDGSQYIIRIEELDTVRVNNGMLIGGSWRSDGTISDQPFKQFNYLIESDKIKSTDDVLEWLRENGIEDRVKKEKYKGYLPQPFHIRQNVKPMVSLKEFRAYIKKQTND